MECNYKTLIKHLFNINKSLSNNLNKKGCYLHKTDKQNAKLPQRMKLFKF